MEGCEINFIESEAFSYLQSLTSLNLNNNNIKQISKNAFDNLKKLSNLELENAFDISNSNLNTLEWVDFKIIFSKITNLNILNLRNCGINKIEAFTFQHLTNLSILNLDFNPLKELKDMKAFSGLNKVKALHLINASSKLLRI